jgi:CheY-like chemotaxis protein
MAKKILLVESDSGFAREMSSALERKGFETRTTGDGKDGLDLARDEQPDAIVLCVELPKLSGYSICTKLKKDEALKTIPVIITSAAATPETFEQHRQLKTRAEDYLHKPFKPAQLLERLTALIGPAPAPDEEVVTLADVELEALAEPEPEEAPLELTSVVDAPAEDEDLRLLDNAFENIAVPAPLDQAPVIPPGDELPLGEEAVSPPPSAAAIPGDEPVAALEPAAGSEDQASTAPNSAVVEEEPLVPASEEPEPRPAPIRGANLDSLRAAGIPVLDSRPMAAPPMAATFAEQSPVRSSPGPDLSRALAGKEQEIESVRRELADRDAELRQLRERIQDLEGRVAQSAADLGRTEANLRARDGELGTVQARLESFSASTRKLETDLRSSREEAHRASEKVQETERDLAQTRQRAEEAERALGEKASETAEVLTKLEASEQKIEGLRTELAAAVAETAAARDEIETRTGALQKRVQELETANTKNEERVVKAYQKIKGDEKLREKTRKALTIALQLLDEHGYGTDPEKQRTSPRE